MSESESERERERDDGGREIAGEGEIERVRTWYVPSDFLSSSHTLD